MAERKQSQSEYDQKAVSNSRSESGSGDQENSDRENLGESNFERLPAANDKPYDTTPERKTTKDNLLESIIAVSEKEESGKEEAEEEAGKEEAEEEAGDDINLGELIHGGDFD